MTLKHNILPDVRRSKLKALLDRGQLVRAIEAHNGLSGIIANDVKIEGQSLEGPICREFDALWESSLTDSAAKGHPDIEVISFDSRLHTINEILAVTDKPMIVDGDTGGEVNHFEYTVSKLEKAGVSAVIIEDKVHPKRNSLESGTQQTLEDPNVFANKIRRGKKIRISSDFMIIARLESLIAGVGLADALERAKIYLQAGADGIMIHSKSKEPGEILQFAERYRTLLQELKSNALLICVPTTYNNITDEELHRAGFQLVIHANHLLRSAFKAMTNTAKNILLNQRSFEAEPACAPVREIFEAVGFLEVKEKDGKDEHLKNIPVIIPAAGEDTLLKTRLGGKPKAMLDIAGKTLLSRQVDSLNANGLTNITVVTGYASNQMKAERVSLMDNPNYKNGSMLHSLFTARERMEQSFIMLYADILLEDHILAQLLQRREDIVLVVDNTIQYHKPEASKVQDFVISKNRRSHARRKIGFTCENIVSKIGAQIDLQNATHEFIGLAKFTKTGAEQFTRTFDDCIQNCKGKIQEADSIEQLTFTDLIQEMTDRGFTVNFIEIHKGWLEIHVPEDIDIANRLF
ncbi:MAG: phosphoenolpyruvate mutase [Nitrospinota bacterium]|nr:phosphoenolpyruvate mutase [Nitrospinota bacterium]